MKTLNTDTRSHRLFNFEYLKVEVGDGRGDSDVSDLLAQLIPVDIGRTHDAQTVMPMLVVLALTVFSINRRCGLY